MIVSGTDTYVISHDLTETKLFFHNFAWLYWPTPWAPWQKPSKELPHLCWTRTYETKTKFWLQHKNTCKTWLLVCITSWDLAICKRKNEISCPFPSCPFFIACLNRFSSMHGFIIIVFHLHGHAFQACHCRWKLASLNFVSSAHYDIELHLKFLDSTIHTFHRSQQKRGA